MSNEIIHNKKRFFILSTLTFFLVWFLGNVLVLGIKYQSTRNGVADYRQIALNTLEILSEANKNEAMPAAMLFSIKQFVSDGAALTTYANFRRSDIERIKSHIARYEGDEPFVQKDFTPDNLVRVLAFKPLSGGQVIGYEGIYPVKSIGFSTEDFTRWMLANISLSLPVSALCAALMYFIVARIYLYYRKSIITSEFKAKRASANLKRKNELLKERVFMDSLTGLPSRYALEQDLAAMKNPRVIILEIDDFNNINDYYGDEVINKLLKTMSIFIKEYSSQKALKAYKFAPDKFVLLENVEIGDLEMDRYEEIAIDLTRKFKGYSLVVPTSLGDVSVEICCTIGFCIERINPLKKALIALESAKRENRDYFCYFKSMDSSAQYIRRRQHSDLIKTAIAENKVIPFFQPIFDREGRIVKYESLVRIITKDDGVILPGVFLDDSKHIKRYSDITKMLVSKCFDEAKANPNLILSVNLSMTDMTDGDVSAFVLSRLTKLNIGRQIIFEVLEDENARDFERTKSFVARVRAAGAKIAIDDFGSGYSNFSYILNLRPDYLKIDGSIIKFVDTDENAYITVGAIVAFAKKLSIKTVAEFVYSKSVYEKCMELGVDEFQGFYLGKPMDKFLPDNLNYVDLYSRADNVSSVKTSQKSDEALTNSSVLRAGNISNFI